jgi:hypothetical protein
MHDLVQLDPAHNRASPHPYAIRKDHQKSFFLIRASGDEPRRSRCTGKKRGHCQLAPRVQVQMKVKVQVRVLVPALFARPRTRVQIS